jgi:hypothetical protein
MTARKGDNMHLQSITQRSTPVFWLDGTWSGGTDEQEDELDEVARGKLDAPTDNEAPGEICESNKMDLSLEEECEKDAGV